MALPFLRIFDYAFVMSISLTRSRRKRIRRSGADDIAWMVNNEHYWSSEALQEILKRIQAICHEDVEEALAAAQSALEILKRRMVRPSPDLVGMTMAIHATALRCNGNLKAAAEIYERALQTEGMTKTGRSDILTRMAVVLVLSDRIEDGLKALNTALRLTPQEPLTLSLRGWAYMERGEFESCLRDCLSVIERTETVTYGDHPFLGAIVNAAITLSYEAGIQVDERVLERLKAAIALYRSSLPTAGSNYYKTQGLRLVLSRAEALIYARSGQEARAISILQRIIEGLRQKFPDDALNASVDLMYLLARQGEPCAAAAEAQRILQLAEDARRPPSQRAINILKSTLAEGFISAFEASELRIHLRLRELPSTWRQKQVA